MGIVSILQQSNFLSTPYVPLGRYRLAAGGTGDLEQGEGTAVYLHIRCMHSRFQQLTQAEFLAAAEWLYLPNRLPPEDRLVIPQHKQLALYLFD